MPVRFAAHERTVISWPCEGTLGTHGDSVVEEPELSRQELAAVARAIATDSCYSPMYAL